MFPNFRDHFRRDREGEIPFDEIRSHFARMYLDPRASRHHCSRHPEDHPPYERPPANWGRSTFHREDLPPYERPPANWGRPTIHREDLPSWERPPADWGRPRTAPVYHRRPRECDIRDWERPPRHHRRARHHEEFPSWERPPRQHRHRPPPPQEAEEYDPIWDLPMEQRIFEIPLTDDEEPPRKDGRPDVPPPMDRERRGYSGEGVGRRESHGFDDEEPRRPKSAEGRRREEWMDTTPKERRGYSGGGVGRRE